MYLDAALSLKAEKEPQTETETGNRQPATTGRWRLAAGRWP